ncbi:MAG: PAS domain-containing protein [Congregibacter sp.]
MNDRAPAGFTEAHLELSDWTSQADGAYLREELLRTLSQSGDALEWILDCCTDGVWYWNLDHTEHEWMSAAFWRSLGQDPDSMRHLSTEWQELIFEEDMKVAEYNFARHCENPAAPYDQVVRYHHNDGGTRWVRCRGVAIRDEEGVVRRLLGAHTDVTSIMRKQTKLIEEQIRTGASVTSLHRMQEELVELRAQNKQLSAQVASQQRLDEELNLLQPLHFQESSEWLIRVAQRNCMPLALIAIVVDSPEQSANDFDGYHRTVLATVSRMITAELPDALSTQITTDVVLAVSIALSAAGVQRSAEAIKTALEDTHWTGNAPAFTTRSLSEEVPDGPAEEVLRQLLAEIGCLPPSYQPRA